MPCSMIPRFVVRDSPTVRFFVVGSLLSITAGVIAFSAYFVWPRWREFQECDEFEQKAKLLHAGITCDEVDRMFKGQYSSEFDHATARDHQGVAFTIHRRFRFNCYFILLKVESPGSKQSSELLVS